MLNIRPLAAALALAVVLDGGLGTWPLATAGWATLLALLCTVSGRVLWAALAFGAGAALAPSAAVVLPIAVLHSVQTHGRPMATRLTALVLPALLAAIGVRVVAGWPLTPALASSAFPTMGAQNLWWLLLENLVLELRTDMVIERVPLSVWSALAWLPLYALGMVALWCGIVGAPTAATFALFSFAMVIAGQSAADAALAALSALGMATEGRRWLAVGGAVVASALANILLAPLGLPTVPPTQAGIDLRTLNALARAALLAVWVIALIWLVAQRLPERWRRLLAAEPPD